MAINGYNLSTKPYLRISGSNVETVVEIQLSEGNRYSTNSRSFPGDRTNESEDVLIQDVLDILKAELDPGSAIVKTQAQLDLLTIEDPEHVEVNGEGKRILVQLNKEFTYNGEPVSAFVTNGSLEQNGTGVAWKFEGKE